MNMNKSLRAITLTFAGLLVSVTFAIEPENNESNMVDLTYVMGKFDPKKNKDFASIAMEFASRDGMLMRREAYDAFQRMYKAALSDTGIKLTVVSATRNFDDQKRIWERKWSENSLIPDSATRARKILEFSSMPGSSRHHWGTDLDLINLQNSYFEQGDGKKIYDWLRSNGKQYGFCQPYTANRATGYQEERWHWSYVPLSKGFAAYAKSNLKNEMISGFNGAENGVTLDILKNYILGINPEYL